jgi:hypothetical protein
MCDFGPASFGVRPDQTNPQRMFAHKISLLAIVDTAKRVDGEHLLASDGFR